MNRRGGRKCEEGGSSSDSDDFKPSTTTASRRRRKNKIKAVPKSRGGRPPPTAADSSEEEEELKRAIELSRQEACLISDSDDDMKRAIALSLGQAQEEEEVVVPRPHASAAGASLAALPPTLVVSEDEFDQMCSAGDLSLKERLSKSSLDSEAEDNSVQIVTKRTLDEEEEENASLPGPSNIPRRKRRRKGEVSEDSCASAAYNGAAASGGPAADSVSSSSAVAGPAGWPPSQRSRVTRALHHMSDEEEESEFAASCSNLLGLDQPGSSQQQQQLSPLPVQGLLSSAEVRERMRSVFTRGLENHLNQEEMEPCRAITTRMHPHQKTALGWMVKQELKEMHGMRGGILADDMGLGKTLTVIALILTNFHDGRPLGKPEIGYVRPSLEPVRGNKKGAKKKKTTGGATSAPDLSSIGSKIKKTPAAKFFDKFKVFDEPAEKKASVSEGKLVANGRGEKSKVEVVDYADSEFSEDEFDRMSQEGPGSLATRLNVRSTGSFTTVADPREKDVDKLMEELEGLSPEERSKRLRPVLLTSDDDEEEELPNPALNLDGAYDSSSTDDDNFPLVKRGRKVGRIRSDDDDEDEVAEPSTAATGPQRRGARRPSHGSQPAAKKTKRVVAADSESDVHLSDIDMGSVSPTPCTSSSLDRVEEGRNGVKQRPVSRRDPAQLKGRRRPTLLVCPTSLISHWCQEIDKHVDRGVALRVKIHHGSSKALIGADLNSFDIVITTYGTLANEFSNDIRSPLQRAKFLRVVLDEGHFIKNHRTKAAKAANNLDTERRWVVTGTPIQNNLLEFWSLVHWLRFGIYADQLPAFKDHIERPCKSHDPRGFERLQVLMDAICMRRTKNDRKPNGEPIVNLPSKTIKIREVELTEEERLCYTVLNNNATEVVLKYKQRGDLLRNYAHIFALMMCLRQMCCHRELIKAIDWSQALRDKASLERDLARLVAQDELGGGGAANDEDVQKNLIVQLRDMLRSGITDDCSICLDDLKTPVITPCAHVFCRHCIERCLESMKPSSCPLCRRLVEKQQLLEAGNYDEEPDKTEDATLAAMKDIMVQHTSSKVDAALREILRIRRDLPDDKIIVVSQFTSFLSMIQPLLDERKLSYVRLDGTMSHMDRADVVSDFQKKTADSPKLLLLSLKAGGVGLNLTAANHMLLLDPAWNPAAEWQCFDRVHRIGQEKDVFIYKFVTKTSIEVKMMELQEKKEELINGAFIMPDEDRRRQRIQDILNIFSLT